MQFSTFGQKFTAQSGILQLMDDLGEALASGGDSVRMLGGGNPAYIPAMQGILRQRMIDMLQDEESFERMVGDYSPPQGNKAFIAALAGLLRQEFGWDLGPENIALTNGSQTSFFYLFNLFAGDFADGRRRKILLPLAPEYIGYADAGISEDFFVANKPDIEYIDERLFKYHVNFDAITCGEEIGAICVSRPTNPTGNVLTDEEITKLSQLARRHDIPFIIDNAYGMPFPSIVFTDARPVWDDHIVLCMSLSKLGMPGPRTGIVVASAPIIKAVAAMNAVLSLAPASTGAVLALDMVKSGEVIRLSGDLIRPFYKAKAEQAVAWLRHDMEGTPCRIHKPEGAFFLWLWFPDLPITSQELYERLKRRGVIIVPGHHFFPGLAEEWQHKQECIRMSYAQDDETVREGIRIIAQEVHAAYKMDA